MLVLQNLSHRYLLTLEPDRLLAWFRREAGLTPKASPYPAWESEELFGGGPLSGHILSFYLSGMSMMYQSTGDPSILGKLKYVIDELKTIQTAGQDGYLAATPNGRHVYEDVFNDNLFKTDGGCLNGCWEPVYVMNKTLQGLHDCYTLCDIEEAFEIEKKLADWFGTQIIDKQCAYHGIYIHIVGIFARTVLQYFRKVVEMLLNGIVLVHSHVYVGFFSQFGFLDIDR